MMQNPCVRAKSIAMNSLCKALSRLASSQSTERRLLPPSILLLQHSSFSTAKKRSPRATTPLTKKRSSSLDWPRPMEIPFQAKVANSVNLIGHVGMPIEYQVSPDGRRWATTVFTQEPTSDQSSPLWIPIVFEGDLAHIAVSHLKKGDHVYIAGQLSSGNHLLDVIQGEAKVQNQFQVMVHSINFVQGSYQSKKNFLLQQKEEKPLEDSVTCTDQSWKELLVKPHAWWDIRSEVDKPNGAAFERKSNGELLWIDNSIPKWIQQKLEVMTFDKKNREKEGKATLKKDGDSALNWGDLLHNPKQWWDYRSNKMNPKFPDFKHKDSGLPLWLNRAPQWVFSELEGVEFDIKSQADGPKQMKQKKGDECWKDLVENPQKWWDNRLNKKNVKSPDFKHKETGEALWLNDAPAWVVTKLP